MDADRQQWLAQVAAACERVLAAGGDKLDRHYAALLADVERLLSTLRAELDERAR